MSEPETITPTKSKPHSSKTDKSHYVGIRFPNPLFEKLLGFPSGKTATILKAFEQFCQPNSNAVSSIDQELLHFLITQFIGLGLSIEFPAELESRLMEIIHQLQTEGKI